MKIPSICLTTAVQYAFLLHTECVTEDILKNGTNHHPNSSAIDLCHSDNKNIPALSLLDNPVLAITTEHLVAYAVHPSYKGAELSPDHLIVVAEWISSHPVEHLTTFISYQATKSPFPRSFFTDQAQFLPPLTSFGVPTSVLSLLYCISTTRNTTILCIYRENILQFWCHPN